MAPPEECICANCNSCFESYTCRRCAKLFDKYRYEHFMVCKRCHLELFGYKPKVESGGEKYTRIEN